MGFLIDTIRSAIVLKHRCCIGLRCCFSAAALLRRVLLQLGT